MSIFAEFRKEFRICSVAAAPEALSQEESEAQRSGRKASQVLAPEALARRWLQLAEADRIRRGLGPPGALDEQAVALRVAQLLSELDVGGRGAVREEDWVHAIYSLGTDRLAEQTLHFLRMALASRPRLLPELQGLFELADTAGNGRLSFKQIADLYSSGVFRVSPKSRTGQLLTDEEVRHMGPERLARELVEAMDVDGDAHVSYSEFMAFCVGRRKVPVYLYLYDLSKGLAQLLSPWILGAGLECIWHSGVVIYGKEYFFAKDAVWDFPGKTDFGVPTKEVFLGYTLWTKTELHSFICNELKPSFHRDTYDAIGNNCNHFADKLSLWLTGNHLPDEVMLQTEKFMKMAAVRALRPALNRALRDHVVARSTPEPGSEQLQATGTGRVKAAQSCSGRGQRVAVGLDEEIMVGTVVVIQPRWGRAAGILGSVCEQPATEIHARGSSKFVQDCVGCALPSFGYCCRPTDFQQLSSVEGEQERDREHRLVWVRFFEFIPPAIVGSAWIGRVVTEAVSRDRVFRVAHEDSVERPSYLAAIAAIVSTRHASPKRSLQQHRYLDDEAVQPTRLGLPQEPGMQQHPAGWGTTRLLGPAASRGGAIPGFEAKRPWSLREAEEPGWSRMDLEDDSVRLM